MGCDKEELSSRMRWPTNPSYHHVEDEVKQWHGKGHRRGGMMTRGGRAVGWWSTQKSRRRVARGGARQWSSVQALGGGVEGSRVTDGSDARGGRQHSGS
jgi:hypothetical protein